MGITVGRQVHGSTTSGRFFKTFFAEKEGSWRCSTIPSRQGRRLNSLVFLFGIFYRPSYCNVHLVHTLGKLAKSSRCLYS
jgi:hypothetical protein